MEMNSMRRPRRWPELAAGLEWDALFTWLLCFGLVVFLGIDGGGYDPLVYSQVGIAIWWLLLLGVAVGAMPRVGLNVRSIAALALLGAFAGWTALSLIWTESAERTTADLARMLTYLGIFALVLLVRSAREPRRLVTAVAAAIAVVALLGLLSRLHPAWFPGADQTAHFVAGTRERLSYPLNYWNGLGALIAIGIPLLLDVASTTARRALVRGAAAAALPGMVLALVFTLSRGGIAAAVIAVCLYLAFARDRLAKLACALCAVAGSAFLAAFGLHREALRLGLDGPLAHHQGNEVLLVGVVVSVLVGLLGAAVPPALRGRPKGAWARPTRAVKLVALGGTVIALIAVALAVNAPSHVSHAVDEFKGGGDAGVGTSRLGSFAGESRYALWESALSENADSPILGTGSGTFEFWWDREGRGGEAVHDTHSLYLQTLGELGIVGLLILAGFLLTVLIGGGRATLRAGPDQRSHLAAALAGCLSFCVSAAIDWTWQIPVLPATLLLLGATLVAAGTERVAVPAAWRSVRFRLAAGIVAIVAVVAIAIPFAATDLIRNSEAEVREGDLAAALEDARSAESVQPDAATPRLQEALVLELRGELPAASRAAHEASEREPTNWRPWLVISRLEAKQGDPAASLRAYREARALYPLSPLFAAH
jgi:O-antigen ligase